MELTVVTVFVFFVVGLHGPGGYGGGGSSGGSGRRSVLLGGQVQGFRLRRNSGASGLRILLDGSSGRCCGQETGGGRHGSGHVPADVAQTVVNVPEVKSRHVQS